MLKKLAVAVGVLAVVLGLGACSSEPTVTVGEQTILIDVRSAAEFQEGPLEGAELLDFNAGEVAAAIPSLDPNAEYLLYCRSGSRAGQALDLMVAAGFTNVTNLGSLEKAADATGLEIVK